MTKREVPLSSASSVLVLLLFILTPTVILGQRVNQLTGAIDVGGAIDDNPFVNRGGLSQISSGGFSWALTAYPTVGLVSSTSRSRFTLDYTFGFEQYQSIIDLRSESQRVSGRYEADLNARWKLRLSDSFTRSPDFSSFLAFRGLVSTPQGILFDVAPMAIRRNGLQNNGDLGFDWSRSPNTSLSFSIRHSLREYDDVPGFSSYSNGQTYGARAELKNKVSARSAWTVGYDVSQFSFERFESARNHDLILGLEHQLRPSVSVRLRAGPSYAEALPGQDASNVAAKSFLGYNVDFGVRRSSRATSIGLSYRRDNSMSVGIGSVSTAHSLGLDFSRKLGRRLTAKLTTSAYDYTARLDSPYDHRGITSTLQFDVLLNRYSSVTIGGCYQTQASDQLISDMERRRLFFCLRFFLSELFQEVTG